MPLLECGVLCTTLAVAYGLVAARQRKQQPSLRRLMYRKHGSFEEPPTLVGAPPDIRSTVTRASESESGYTNPPTATGTVLLLSQAVVGDDAYSASTT